MEEGKYLETEEGTPQGGILSPVLSNVYLHYVLDLYDRLIQPIQCIMTTPLGPEAIGYL